MLQSSSMASSVAAISSAYLAASCPSAQSSLSTNVPFSSSSPFLPCVSKRSRLPHLRSSSSVTGSRVHVRRSSSFFRVKATASSEDSTATDFSKQLQETLEELKAKYDAMENKSTVWIYGGGALVAVWLSSIIVSAVNSVPVLPKILELVGIGYSGWFVYRYLLFKSSRKQLSADFQELKLKITGVPRSAFLTEDDE